MIPQGRRFGHGPTGTPPARSRERGCIALLREARNGKNTKGKGRGLAQDNARRVSSGQPAGYWPGAGCPKISWVVGSLPTETGRDRHRRLRPSRPGRRSEALGRRLQHDPPNDYSPDRPRPPRAHRPHPGFSCHDRISHQRYDVGLQLPSTGTQPQVAPRTDPHSAAGLSWHLSPSSRPGTRVLFNMAATLSAALVGDCACRSLVGQHGQANARYSRSREILGVTEGIVT
jgi:hypothetical protein